MYYYHLQTNPNPIKIQKGITIINTSMLTRRGEANSATNTRHGFTPNCLYFILIALFFCLVSTKICEKIEGYNCKICYNLDHSQDYLHLLSCQQQSCEMQGYASGGSFCLKYVMKDIDKADCFHHCCLSDLQEWGTEREGEVYYAVSILQKCHPKMKAAVKLAIGISVGLFCSCSLLVIYYKRRRRSFQPIRGGGGRLQLLLHLFCCCLKPKIQNVASNANGGDMQNSIQAIDIQGQLKTVDWKHTTEALKGDTNCAICLSGQIDTETKCCHYFHVNCIFQWVRRKPTCPLCLSDVVGLVRVYCRGCASKYVEVALTSKEIPGRFICPTCL